MNIICELELITINGFLRETKFDIDAFMIDKFYLNLQDDISLYMTDETIERMGYS